MDHSKTTLRRRVAGASLIGAPLLGLPTSQIWPDTPIDPPGRLAVIADHSGAYLAANLLTVLMIVLFVPALLGMVHLLRNRKATLGHVGGGLALLGIVGWSGTTAVGLVELEMAKAPDRAAMVGLAERFQSSVGTGLFLAMFLLGIFVGLIVLAVGLWRAGIAPGWVPLAVTAAVVLDMVASTEQIAVAAVWILLTSALGWLGVATLKLSNTEWEGGAAPARGDRRPQVVGATADA